MAFLVKLVNLAVAATILLIIARALLSWFPDMRQRYWQAAGKIDRFTEPLLRPVRNIVPPEKTQNVDVSPAIVIIILEILRKVMIGLLLR